VNDKVHSTRNCNTKLATRKEILNTFIALGCLDRDMGQITGMKLCIHFGIWNWTKEID
jgi:hypothetical protein